MPVLGPRAYRSFTSLPAFKFPTCHSYQHFPFSPKPPPNMAPSMDDIRRTTSARGRIRGSPYSSGTQQVCFSSPPQLYILVFAGTTFGYVHRPCQWKPSTTRPSSCSSFFKALYDFFWRSNPWYPHSGTGKRISQTISWIPFLHYVSHESGTHEPCFPSRPSTRSFS